MQGIAQDALSRHYEQDLAILPEGSKREGSVLKRLLSLLVAAGLFVACAAGCGPRVKADRTVKTDVLVVGAGGAGLTAAVEARSLGAKVIVIEKTASPGGGTVSASGGFDAAGTKWQKDAGVDYPPARLAQDIFNFGEQKGNKALIDILASKSAEAMNFMESNGMKIKMPDPTHYPTRHQAQAGSTGSETIKTLQAAAKNKGVTIELNTTATELVVDNKGAVTGVKATTKDGKTVYYNARATILTTGGFGANSEMVNENAKDWAGIGTDLASRTATGDGIRLAKAIGADLVNMQYLQAWPTVSKKGTALRGLEAQGAILVNKKGERFVNELQNNNAVSAAILKQEGKTAFLVFGGEFAKANESSVKSLESAGILETADKVEDLASKIGVPPSALKATLDEYSKAVAAKADTKFQRPALPLPIKEPKFYAVAVHPAVYTTLGGVRINENAQVTKGGTPLPGLYAAGEVAGGIFGTNKFNVSQATSNIVFGRIAAQSAVKSFKK